MREFDRTVASLGYADAPSARAICARLTLGWRQIVEAALSPKPSVKKTDAPMKRDEAKWLTDRHVFFALNTIARFKEVETMTEDDYDIYLAEYLAAHTQPAHVLGRNARFPTSSQILRIAQGLTEEKAETPWDRALIFAGLQPVAKVTANALTLIEAINLYIEATLCEFFPSRDELLRLRSEFAISFQERERGKKWSQSLREALDGRAANGLPVPTMLASTATKPPLVIPPGFATPPREPQRAAGPRRPMMSWSRR